jgi:hypothetical protein
MRRISTVSILQQATLLADLLRHADPAALSHHRPAIEAFFATLREHAIVTHSVVPAFPPGEFRPPGDPAGVSEVLEAIVDRRIKIAPKA